MRKLTPQQINTIAYLKGQGIKTIIIARVLQMMAGVALSATYHHVWKLEEQERQKKKKYIVRMIEKGYTTGEIAHRRKWPLSEVNKIYIR